MDSKSVVPKTLVVCRLCGDSDTSFVRILESNGSPCFLTQLVHRYLHVQVAAKDSLPKVMCKLCHRKIQDFHQFFTRTRKTQELLSAFEPIETVESPNHDDNEKQKLDHQKYSSSDCSINKTIEQKLAEDQKDDMALTTSNDSKNSPKSSLDIAIVDVNDEESLHNIVDDINKMYSDIMQDSLAVEVQQEKKIVDVAGKSYNIPTYKDVKLDMACTECPEHLSNYSAIALHYQEAHGMKPAFQCGICHKIYKVFSCYRKHFLDHNSEESIKKAEKKRKPQQLSCDVCTAVYASKRSLTRHMKIHLLEDEPKTIYECGYCGKRFSKQVTLDNHLKTHILFTEELKQYPCETCGKCLKTPQSFKIHMKIHQGNRDWICHICQRAFLEKGSLRHHLKTHDVSQRTDCPICGKTYLTEILARAHMKRHQEKRFKCNVCNRAFFTGDKLHAHNMIHTGELPFQCEYCAKRFRQKKNLAIHVRVHTGEKPYYCKYCDTRFSCWATYNKHTKSKLHLAKSLIFDDLESINGDDMEVNNIKEKNSEHTEKMNLDFLFEENEGELEENYISEGSIEEIKSHSMLQ